MFVFQGCMYTCMCKGKTIFFSFFFLFLHITLAEHLTSAEQDKIGSQLVAQFMPFIQLIAHSYILRKSTIFYYFAIKVPCFNILRQNRAVFNYLQQNNAGACYFSSDLLTKPLLGSQGRCSARSVATALQHFIQP